MNKQIQEGKMQYVCDICIRVHGRDSNQKIQCPTCGKIIGCFWHKKNIKHIRECRVDKTEEQNE